MLLPCPLFRPHFIGLNSFTSSPKPRESGRQQTTMGRAATAAESK